MELKGRLKLISSKVPACNIICDVGTDHAFIPVYLVKNNLCKRAIACDIRKGPLLAAEENIERFSLKGSIETRLGNGLDSLAENEADVIIIAGMGGVLISNILKSGFQKAKKANSLILQPMNGIEVVREWAYHKGFDIYDEEMAGEGEKIYNVMALRWTGEIRERDEIYYYVGERLIEKRDPLLKRYIEKKMIYLDQAVKGLEKSGKDKTGSGQEGKYVILKEKYLNIYHGLTDI